MFTRPREDLIRSESSREGEEIRGEGEVEIGSWMGKYLVKN